MRNRISHLPRLAQRLLSTCPVLSSAQRITPALTGALALDSDLNLGAHNLEGVACEKGGLNDYDISHCP
jgi:hypothetical protein